MAYQKQPSTFYDMDSAQLQQFKTAASMVMDTLVANQATILEAQAQVDQYKEDTGILYDGKAMLEQHLDHLRQTGAPQSEVKQHAVAVYEVSKEGKLVENKYSQAKDISQTLEKSKQRDLLSGQESLELKAGYDTHKTFPQLGANVASLAAYRNQMTADANEQLEQYFKAA